MTPLLAALLALLPCSPVPHVTAPAPHVTAPATLSAVAWHPGSKKIVHRFVRAPRHIPGWRWDA